MLIKDLFYGLTPSGIEQTTLPPAGSSTTEHDCLQQAPGDTQGVG